MSRNVKTKPNSKKNRSFQEELMKMLIEMREKEMRINMEKRYKKVLEQSKNREEDVYIMIYGKSALSQLR